MASRFWVLGTGTWDASDTTHWSATSGGAPLASVPGASDDVTFDGSSGGGTVTVNTTVTVASITGGAFTGTLTFSTNNNNVTLSGIFNFNGSGTRTLNLGNGTWTLTGTGTIWNMGGTNLTFNANSSTIVFSGSAAVLRTFTGGNLTYNNLTFGANTSVGASAIGGSNTFATLTATAPCVIEFPSGSTTTLTSLVATGTSANKIFLTSSSFNFVSTINRASGSNALDWTGLHNLTFGGGATWTATNSFDLVGVSGITVTVPSSGGGGGSVFSATGGVIA